MPTRRQRRRAAKEKRHEYETVWVDAEGNELEELPEEALAQERTDGRNGKAKSRPEPRGPAPQQRGGRADRTPPPPSWQRAGKRALLLGVVVFALFYLTGGKSGNRLPGALALASAHFQMAAYASGCGAGEGTLRRRPPPAPLPWRERGWGEGGFVRISRSANVRPTRAPGRDRR